MTQSVVKIIFAVLLGGQGLLFIIGNTIIFWKTWIKRVGDKEYVPSVMPFLGGLFCAAAILLIFGLEHWYLAVIPMLLDWGCIPAIIRLVIFLCLHGKELFVMGIVTGIDRKRVKTIIIQTSVIAFAVLVFAVLIIGFKGSVQIKRWHIFNKERLEEIYNADFPEDTKFSYYSAVWNFVDIFDTVSIDYTLYINDVADPERFCRETFNASTEIGFIADYKNARVVENNYYNEEYAETIASSAKNEKWSIGERPVDFFCIAYCSEPQINCGLAAYKIYFSPNDSGGYDVKIFMETLGY